MSIRRLLTRLLFALPGFLLRWLAGGPVTVDGRTLDPRIALMARDARRRRPLSSLPVPVAREGMRASLGLVDAAPRPRVAARDLEVPGGDGAALPARLYAAPGPASGRALIVYFHQGGCVIGGLWTCDAWCSQLADETGAVVLNAEYRKAPEHRFPAAVDDAVAVYAHAVQQAPAWGADPRRVAVGGDSAGGYLSAVVCHARKRAGLAQPALQLLIYPCVDWTAQGGSMASMAGAWPLDRALMDWFAAQYLGEGQDLGDWRVSPALQPDLAGLAPALIYNAAFDPLASQGEAYAAQLVAAGTPARHRCFDSLSHSFTAMGGTVPAARAALALIASETRAALAASAQVAAAGAQRTH